MPPYRDSHVVVVVWLVVSWVEVREKDSEKVSTYAWWYSYLRDGLSLNSQEIIHDILPHHLRGEAPITAIH